MPLAPFYRAAGADEAPSASMHGCHFIFLFGFGGFVPALRSNLAR